MNPTVRPARTADVPAIRTIAERGWRATYDEFLSDEAIDRALAEWYNPEYVRGELTDDDVVYLVAEDDGVVGYVGGGPAEAADTAHLGAIYVEPERWGEEIGSTLLAAFEDRWLARGRDRLQFRVLAENDVAIPFYRAHGYEVHDRTDATLFGEPVEELVFGGPIERDE